LSAGRIALGYAVIATVWIAFSDELVSHLKLNPAMNIIKGTAFVLVTASLLYVTIRRLVETVRLTSEELRQSQAYLAEAQSLSHTGSWQLDVLHDRLSWSDEVFRIFGIQLGTPLTYESFLSVVHADDRALVDESWKKALRGAPYDIEHRILVGREVRWVRERAQLKFDPDGRATNAIGTVQDITDRKRAEEALRERADLLNLTHDSVLVMDMTGVITYWNRGAEERYGWSAEQAVGRVVHEMLHTVFPSPVEDLKAEVTRTGRWEGELLHARKDGTQVAVASRWALQRDEQGAPVAILETNNDITERKRAEEALRQGEAYLREAQRLSHTGSWAFDVAGDRYLYISEECFRIFGLDPEAALPKREVVFRRIHPDDSERVDLDFRRSVHEKVDVSSEFRIVLADGAIKTVHVIRHPVLNGSGNVGKLVGTVVDITDRKRAEEELRESETRFRTFVDNAGDALFVEDLEEAIVVDVNRQACESLGCTRQDLIGKTPLAFHVDSDRARVAAAEERAAAGDAVSDRHWHRRKDGSVFPVEVHTTVFSYGGRRFLLKIARDITDRLQAEEQRETLRQLETDLAHINRVSMMGELAASIAHEVNQPLSGVVTNGSACLRWLTRDTPDLEEAREAARRIVRDGKRAAEVIAGIRGLTRRAVAPREELDLNQTIREVLALVTDQAKKNAVIIRTQFGDDLPPVSGDRVQLQQVVLNLIMNGIEAMSTVDDRLRELVITTRTIDADQVHVTVEDSGLGIDPKMMARIFEPFYTTKRGGMGMGLSISKSILHAHGGRLWATAKDGSGTSLHFTLPRCEEESAA
jgi:PAS domain S-box-containing protein